MNKQNDFKWTRDHDMSIAINIEKQRQYGDGYQLVHLERGGEAGWHESYPPSYYILDLKAGMRAAAAWIGDWYCRDIKFERCIEGWHCILGHGSACYLGIGKEMSEALAMALLRVVEKMGKKDVQWSAY